MNIKRAIGGPILAIVFLIIFGYMVLGANWVFDNFTQKQTKNNFLGNISEAAVSEPVQNIIQPTPTTEPKPEINAKSAICIESDLQTSEDNPDKIIFDKNSNTKLPIASLTKLMTAIIVLDNYNLSDIIVVDKTADSQDSMPKDIKIGDKMSVENLLNIMIIGSSNKSAYALSEKIGETKFVDMMNQKAKEIGLQNTSFSDPTGLSPKDISTAIDLAKLAEYILKNYPKIAGTSKLKEFYVPGVGDVKNTDQLLGEIPDIICSKTGFTAAAKGCLLLVINNPENNGYLINVILGADDRFSEMKKMINWSSAVCN